MTAWMETRANPRTGAVRGTVGGWSPWHGAVEANAVAFVSVSGVFSSGRLGCGNLDEGRGARRVEPAARSFTPVA